MLSPCGLPGYTRCNKSKASFPTSGETFLGLTFLAPCLRTLWEKNPPPPPYVKEPYYEHAKDELRVWALF